MNVNQFSDLGIAASQRHKKSRQHVVCSSGFRGPVNRARTVVLLAGDGTLAVFLAASGRKSRSCQCTCRVGRQQAAGDFPRHDMPLVRHAPIRFVPPPATPGETHGYESWQIARNPP
jgi:hypothetical protein